VGNSKKHERLSGISASRGIGIGTAFVHHLESPPVSMRRISAVRVEGEVQRFLNAVRAVGDEIRRTRRMVEMEHGPDLAQIFDAQLAMLEDNQVKGSTVSCIRKRHCTAERALTMTMADLKTAFADIENEYLRARVADIMDIEHQVLMRLAAGELHGLESVRSNTIVIARDLLPSEAILLGRRFVKGLVTDAGGATTHASIIARSLGLPTVVGTESGSRAINSGDLVVVDGDAGVVHVRPKFETLRHYRVEVRRHLRRERDLLSRADLPAVTLDGAEVDLVANIDLPSEIEVALANGAKGVGMYRTEFLFLGYDLPGEEQQLASYRRIVQEMAPGTVVIRTLDLGGDKLFHAVDTTPESNPFLGWRGIRLCLGRPDIFKTQLRAILRAATGGDVQILLPMVSDIDQVREVRQILAETTAELERAGQPAAADCKLGIMIEVPAAAIMADHFAPQVDFFSLGTNDLVQYTLAVDRGTAKVADLYDQFHPAVLQLIKTVADSGSNNGIPVSICGEMAGDPIATPLLLGLGLTILSLSPGLIPEVKEVIRSVDMGAAQQLARQCLGLHSGAEVRAALGEAMADRQRAKIT